MKTTIIATGDSFITKPLSNYAGFDKIKDVIMSHDVRFNNLEITIHEKEGYPAAYSGGTWAMASPCRLDDLNKYGFNVYNTANNHSLDYSHGGLLATIKNLEARGAAYCGTGCDMESAAAPCYIKTGNATVALIGASSTFHDSDIAGPSNDAIFGRPGLNTVRVNETYFVTKAEFDALKHIAKATDINSYEDFKVKNGYSLPSPEGELNFGGHKFMLSDKTCKKTSPHRDDMSRIEAQIQSAKKSADIVLVSMHSHELKDADPVIPDDFYVEFCHRCIDAGADAILGHGPHELRGIEIYGGKPIFYSLGNFIFQTETVSLQPAEAYLSKGFDKNTSVDEYMRARSKGGTSGYIVQPNIWRAVMASLTIEDKKITDITLYPINIGLDTDTKQVAFPTLSNDCDTLEYIAKLSEPFGTKIDITNAKVVL